MSLKTNIRLYGGVCPDCGLFLWRYLKRRSAKSGVPGVHLRCSECTAIAYARPVRSHTIRQEPEWVADPGEVVEWFERGGGGSTDTESRPVAATDGGDPVETRFGPVDLGCYLQWRKTGKIQQRTLADFKGGVSA